MPRRRHFWVPHPRDFWVPPTSRNVAETTNDTRRALVAPLVRIGKSLVAIFPAFPDFSLTPPDPRARVQVREKCVPRKRKAKKSADFPVSAQSAGFCARTKIPKSFSRVGAVYFRRVENFATSKEISLGFGRYF